MKVLIAGCGWLGSEVGRRLIARGDRVVGIRRSPDAAAALRREGIEPLILDLADPRAADRLPRDVEAIVACQAAGAPGRQAYARAYLDATRRLLDLASVGPGTRLVYTGSTGVFGPDNGERVDETSRPRPGRPEAEILLEAERTIGRSAADGLPACLVRLSGLYGPGRFGIVDRVRSGRMALGPGDDAWMNFCHLADAAQTVLALLDRGRPGAVYHASDAAPPRRREVIRWIADRLGIEPATAGGPPPASGRRPPSGRRVSAERTRDELGLTLAYPSFRDGLAEAVAGLNAG